MRILHLVGRSHRRGAEQVAMELANELDLLGHDNRLAAVSLGHDRGRVDGLDPLVFDDRQRPAQLLRAAWGVRARLRRAPVEVIVAHGAAATLVATLAAPRRPPLIVTQTILALVPGAFTGGQGACWRVAARRLDGAVALTPALGEELRRLGYRGPLWPLPNGRRLDRFAAVDPQQAAVDLRAELGTGPGTALIGLVGYLVDQKRPERAVEVLAQVRAAGHDAHLVVAGSGPLDASVRGCAEDLGVASHLSMLGHRDDVEKVLAGLDVVVLTSDDEGVPGVVVEAAMAGCPVVTFPLGGVATVVEHDVTGLVLDGAEVPAMAEAVSALLDDADRRARMSQSARARGAEYAMDRIARRYAEHLQSLVDQSLVDPPP